MSLISKIESLDRRLRAYYNTDLSTPENRRRAQIYNLWFDHAILRKFWTNEFEIAPGVLRSNQPTHERFVALKARGIRTVINLRGESTAAHYLVEQESCAQLGLALFNVALHSRQAAARDEVVKLLDFFRTAERPMLLHCKSGADRAGFASAAYLLSETGATVEAARKMLSLRFAHMPWSSAGIHGYVLDCYARQAEGVDFRRWIENDYDPNEITAGFGARKFI